MFFYGPLPIRIFAGVALMAHGIPKLLYPETTMLMFGSLGLPVELALPVGTLEVVGGMLILAGFLTRIASAFLISEMVGAVVIVNMKGLEGGFMAIELDLLLIAISASLLFMGPGRVSVEYNLLKREVFLNGKNAISKIQTMNSNK
jgi:putative oxidoreductase